MDFFVVTVDNYRVADARSIKWVRVDRLAYSIAQGDQSPPVRNIDYL